MSEVENTNLEYFVNVMMKGVVQLRVEERMIQGRCAKVVALLAFTTPELVL